MTLIVGLGNPTAKYAHNRHNIGFMAVDHMIGRLRPTPASKPNFKGELFKTSDLLLLKPTTYMNLSGESVKAVYDYYKPNDVIVLHDELEIAFGSLRLKRGGGHGGHNGLRSIDTHLFKEYIRVRLGIGRPVEKSDVANYVLSDFAKSEHPCLATLLDAGVDAALSCASSSLEMSANRFSGKNFCQAG